MSTEVRNPDTYIGAMVLIDGDIKEIKYQLGGALPPYPGMREAVWEETMKRAEKEWGDQIVYMAWESDLKLLEPAVKSDKRHWDATSEPEPKPKGDKSAVKGGRLLDLLRGDSDE